MTQIEAVDDEEIIADHMMTKESHRAEGMFQKEPKILKDKAEAKKPYDQLVDDEEWHSQLDGKKPVETHATEENE